MANDGPHRLPVLLVPGLIEAILLADAFFDGGRQRFLTRIEVSGREFDQDPCDRDHDEDRWDRYQETSDNEPKHSLMSDLLEGATPQSYSACRNPTSPGRV